MSDKDENYCDWRQSDCKSLSTLRAQVEASMEALRPFAEYREWARRMEWPVAIANDPSTPVFGRESYDGEDAVALYVRDFDNARTAFNEAKKALTP